MIFVDDGPDIPDEILDAQQRGDLLILAGAGVSVNAGLPNFGDLVREIYSRLGEALPNQIESVAGVAERTAFADGESSKAQWDRLLHLLEKRRVYDGRTEMPSSNEVRQATAEIISSEPTNLSAHSNILEISKNPQGVPFVVTTNFDLYFEKAWENSYDSNPAVFSGPGSPAIGSPEFRGIIHLHGHVAGDGIKETSLVLTSADFGEAYMRSGWASRFMYDAMRRYVILLIGYSANDPPMRYMLEAVEAGRLRFNDLKTPFAIDSSSKADEGDIRENWRAKGVRPILFDKTNRGYEPLYDTFDQWSKFSKDPANWAKSRVTKDVVCSFSKCTPNLKNRVRDLVKRQLGVTHFADIAEDFDWIECLRKDDKHGSIEVQDCVDWLAKKYSSPHAPDWVLSLDNETQRKIAGPILRRVVKSDLPRSSGLRKFWTIFGRAYNTNAVYRRSHISFMDIRKDLSTVPSTDAIDAIIDVLKPVLEVSKPHLRDLFGEKDPDSDALVHDFCYTRYKCADWHNYTDILKACPKDPDFQWQLLSALDRTLTEVSQESFEIDEIRWSGQGVQLVHPLEEGERYTADQDPHEKMGWKGRLSDENDTGFVPIVRCMSALWRTLASNSQCRAHLIAKSWLKSEIKLFNRLGFFAAFIDDAGPVDEAIEILSNIDAQGFWYDHLEPEMAQFRCKKWNDFSPKLRYKIEKIIRAGPVPSWYGLENDGDHQDFIDYRRFQELGRISTSGGKLTIQSQKLLGTLTKRLGRTSSRVAMVEGLVHQFWSGSGYTGDPTVTEGLSEAQLLPVVDSLSQNFGANRSLENNLSE